MDERQFRALIVDDAYINRTLLASQLASFGVSSDEAENGLECVELCTNNTYDLIFLDQRMPELDGADTLARLKDIFKEKGLDIPVICHTAEDALNQADTYKQAGYTDVLSKPVQPKQLSALLRKYLPEGALPAPQLPSDDPAHLETELALLPDWLRSQDGLNLRSALEHCGTAKDYLDALSAFLNCIAEKANEIEQLLKNEDWKTYTLRVHSLKSTSRLIGADELSDLAAGLETAGDQADIAQITSGTPVFLEKYRAFLALLSHTTQESMASNITAKPFRYVRRSILFIEGDEGFIPNAIVNKLRKAGFTVACVPDNIDIVSERQDEAQIFLYYLPKTIEHALRTTQSLLALTQKEHKTLCLAGESYAITQIREQDISAQIYAFYQRPMDIDELVADMKKLSASHDEFYRLKTILLVDDDPSFLQIVTPWLSDDYHVATVSSGAEALEYLERTRPNLILLDYEMPGLDGYQVLEQLRQNPMTAQVPIIFLTGQNDKDNVLRILHRKPDGYVLKTATKDDLLNTLNRFFVNSILDHKK